VFHCCASLAFLKDESKDVIMILKKALLLLPFLGFAYAANAKLEYSATLPAFATLPFPNALYDNQDTYRIGDVWGKQEISNDDMAALPSLDRSAHATAHLGGATAFVIGKFGGEWILATNYHVCSYDYSCEGRGADFVKGNMRITVKKFLHSWTDIDLALLTLDVAANSKEEKYLATYAANFDYTLDWQAGQEIVTVGFGTAGNWNQNMVGNWDADCRIFSRPGDVRFMADPDSLNPADYMAWSIAVGCDASHGDSGSSMVDRATGRVVGIIWTGKFPKAEPTHHSDHLAQMLASDSPEIWQELNFVVPAKSIQSVIQATLIKEKLDAKTAAILAEVSK
jgi:hypothetical protein